MFIRCAYKIRFDYEYKSENSNRNIYTDRNKFSKQAKNIHTVGNKKTKHIMQNCQNWRRYKQIAVVIMTLVTKAFSQASTVKTHHKNRFGTLSDLVI